MMNSFLDDSGHDSRDHFIKQRRNLVLMSLFIIFYKVGNLKIEKISFLGNQTDVGNPGVVGFALAIFFVYFLYRYYTACNEVEGWVKFVASTREWGDKKTSKKAHEMVANVERHGEPHIKKRNWTTIIYTFHPTVRVLNEDRKDLVFGCEIWHWRLLSPILGIINHGAFSEYILPYLLALIVVLDFWGFSIVGAFMGLFGFKPE